MATLISPSGQTLEFDDDLHIEVTRFITYLEEKRASGQYPEPDKTHLQFFEQQIKQKSVEHLIVWNREIKRYLTPIQGYSQVLLMRPSQYLDEQKEDFLNKVITSANNLARDFRVYAMLHTLEAMGLNHQRMIASRTFTEIIHQILQNDLAHQITEKTLQVTIKSNLPHETVVWGEKYYLQEAILMILENAVKYTPENGEIAIQLDLLNEHWRITIQDTGIGIPQDDLNRVFEPFFTATNHLDGRGWGLGLTYAKTIIEAHHGRIWVESAEGQGTSVYIELPVHQA